LIADHLYRWPTETQSESTLGPAPIHRLGLHARSLTLVHPFTNQALRFEAPYPPDFAAALKQLRQHPKA
jgi:23S rRNA-/tRNA-specific pseudouridylate synthase